RPAPRAGSCRSSAGWCRRRPTAAIRSSSAASPAATPTSSGPPGPSGSSRSPGCSRRSRGGATPSPAAGAAAPPPARARRAPAPPAPWRPPPRPRRRRSRSRRASALHPVPRAGPYPPPSLPVALQLVAALGDAGVVRRLPAHRGPGELPGRLVEHPVLTVGEEADGADEDPRDEAQLRALGVRLETAENFDLLRELESCEGRQELAVRRRRIHLERVAVQQRRYAAGRGERGPLRGAHEPVQKLDHRVGGPRRDRTRRLRALALRLRVVVGAGYHERHQAVEGVAREVGLGGQRRLEPALARQERRDLREHRAGAREAGPREEGAPGESACAVRCALAVTLLPHPA